MLIVIKVREIKAGDVFPGPGGWVARKDAWTPFDSHTQAEVMFRDGGIGIREWMNPDHELQVEREDED